MCEADFIPRYSLLNEARSAESEEKESMLESVLQSFNMLPLEVDYFFSVVCYSTSFTRVNTDMRFYISSERTLVCSLASSDESISISDNWHQNCQM